jgi:proteic killer suppression protein
MFAKFANSEKKSYLCTAVFENRMEITFEKEYLRELFYDGVASDKQHRYQPHIIRKYVRVLNILDSVDRPADLFRYRSLHYEKLVGDKAGLESVRVNDQYRIEFKTSARGEITICNITELSNHYK